MARDEMMFAVAVTVGVLLLVGGALWVELRPKRISGDRLREISLWSDSQSTASWFLYKKKGDEYCFRYSRPVLPEHFCVKKTDVEVVNGPNGTSEIGYVRQNQLVLKAGRYKGASEEVF